MDMPLLAWGEFRFSLSTYAYEKFKRKFGARLEAQKVIGSRPVLHNMGPDEETVEVNSTFFPFHLDGNQGLEQVSRMRAAVGKSNPLIGNALGFGSVLGNWALKTFEETKTEIHPTGEGQKIEVEMSFVFDPDEQSAGSSSPAFQLFG